MSGQVGNPNFCFSHAKAHIFFQRERFKNDTYYVFNHVDVTISYHRDKDNTGSRITKVKVSPMR